MGTRKDQHKVGTPEKPRGQQTGFAGHSDQNRMKIEETPAVRGRLMGSKMLGDVSSQHISSDAVTPSSNSPSTPAMNVPAKDAGGGEAVFKQRLARMRAKYH